MIQVLRLQPAQCHHLVLARWHRTRRLPHFLDVAIIGCGQWGVLQESVGALQVEMQGALVYDCKPPLLPVSLWLEDIGELLLSQMVASATGEFDGDC